MTFDEYQRKARRTQNSELTNDEKRLHALHGLCAEVGEVNGIFQKKLQGHDIKRTELVGEIGDVLWMLSELCDTLGLTLDGVAQYNIDKLEKRYPDGFSTERSVNRQGSKEGN